MKTVVGIDIAARTFDWVVRQNGVSSNAKQFKQSPEGHAQAVQQLKRLKPCLIVMEATGIYYLDLAMALVQADLPVAVINPKSFRHFAALTLTGSKTDPVDA